MKFQICKSYFYNKNNLDVSKFKHVKKEFDASDLCQTQQLYIHQIQTLLQILYSPFAFEIKENDY